MKFVSKSPKETQKVAADLAHKIIKTVKTVDNRLAKSVIHRRTVIALEGELGAGKTVFVKGFAKALGIKSKIKSPTFVLMKKYVIPKSAISRRRLDMQGDALTLYHLDCYRVRDEKDLRIPELKEILNMSHNNNVEDAPLHIVLIEWAERVREILPKKHITVHIDHINKNTRKLLISND